MRKEQTTPNKRGPKKGQARRQEPPARPLWQERCYCWDHTMPHEHLLGEHWLALGSQQESEGP